MIVIRSVGERTVPVVKKIYPEAYVLENIFPFREALRQGFETALKSKDEFVTFIDGDVIPDTDMVEVLEGILKENKEAYAVAPKMKDYLTGKKRVVGVHSYRIEYLPDVLKILKNITKNNKRPESSIRFNYSRKRLKTDFVLGEHGKEQYFYDIYRTVLFWSKKSADNKKDYFKYWDSKENLDFKVAKQAWLDGKKIKLSICDASIKFDIQEVFDKLEIQEKEKIDLNKIA